MEVVVRPNELNLLIDIRKRTIVPEANVVNGLRISLNDFGVHFRFSRVELLGDAIKAVCAACELNVTFDVLLLAHELVRIHGELLNQVGPEGAKHDIRHKPQGERANQQPSAAEVSVGKHQQTRGKSDYGHNQQGGHAGVHIGIRGTEHRALFGQQQVPSIDPVAQADREHHERR